MYKSGGVVFDLNRNWEALNLEGPLGGLGRPEGPESSVRGSGALGQSGLVLGRFGGLEVWQGPRKGVGVEPSLLKNQFFGPGTRSALALM